MTRAQLRRIVDRAAEAPRAPLPAWCQPWVDIPRPADIYHCREDGHLYEGGECVACGADEPRED